MLPIAAAMHMDVSQQGIVQMRVEQRYRRASDIKTEETELDPVLRYDVSWNGGQNHFVSLYQPRLIYLQSQDRRLPDPNLINRGTINTEEPDAQPFSALHNGGVGIESVHQRWRLSAYQYLAYGSIPTTLLLRQEPWAGGGPPPDPQPLIPATIGARFTLLFIGTQIIAPIRLSERTALIPAFFYNAFGGADRTSRGVIALTQGPAASVALEHAATPNDRFTTTVGAGSINTTFQDEREGVLIYRTEASQQWRHWYSAHLSHDLSGGAALGGDEINGFALYSLGQAALLWDSWPVLKLPPGAPPQDGPPGRGNRLQIGAVAKVAPWIDIFSGDLEQRFVTTLAANYTVDRVTLRGAVSQARVVNTPNSVAKYQIVTTEGSIRYQFLHEFFGEVGVRAGYQDFDNAIRFNELTHLTSWAALTWAPLPAKF